MNGKSFVVAAAAAWGLASTLAFAVDGIAVEAGNGHDTDMVRLALQWNWSHRWFESGNWHLGGYWDAEIGHWHRRALPGQNDEINEIGLTPVLRYQRNDGSGPYFEGGIGAHLLSETTLGDKRFGSLFQFGDHLGVGYRFGKGGWLDVSLRLQHLSNGGIKEPNNGINFRQVRVQYRY